MYLPEGLSDEARQEFDELGLDKTQYEQLRKYYELLEEWNQKFNLTAIIEEAAVYVKHFLDSFSGSAYFKSGASVLDMGCGAGFPSVPLGILRPDLRFDLIDSVGKKITFVNAVIDALALNGRMSARHSRIEYLKQKSAYDHVAARALSPLPTLLEYAVPYLKVGGTLVAYKGSAAKEEIAQSANALKELGAEVAEVHAMTIDGNMRTIIVVKKLRPTPAKYPRGQNKPRISPL